MIDFFFWTLIILVVADIALSMFVRKHHDEILKTLEKSEKNGIKIVKAKVEKYQDCFYFFNAETDDFILQGSTKDELDGKLKYIPGTKILVVDGEPDVLDEIKAWQY